MASALAFVSRWSLAVLGVACFPQFGSYDSAAQGGGDAGPFTRCGAGERGHCVAVPPGWEGPVAMSDAAAGCAAPYGRQAFIGQASIAFEPADCNCVCSDLAVETCAAQTVVEAFVSPDCSGSPASSFGVGAGCNTGAAAASAKSIRVVPPDPAGSGCTVVMDEPAVPPVEVEEVAVCVADGAAPACPGGLCFSAPNDGGALCVWAPGELECPHPFVQRRVLRRGPLEDSRACTPCTCGSTSQCQTTVAAYDAANCTNEVVVVDAAAPTCRALPDAGFSSAMQVASRLAPGSCMPDAVPTGDVMPGEPVTVCCSPALDG